MHNIDPESLDNVAANLLSVPREGNEPMQFYKIHDHAKAGAEIQIADWRDINYNDSVHFQISRKRPKPTPLGSLPNIIELHFLRGTDTKKPIRTIPPDRNPGCDLIVS
jgi:hypothetical protein